VTQPPLPPHPVLTDYYASRDDRSGFVHGLFNRTAGDYDRINGIFSLGTGGRYRRQALARAGLGRGDRVLDVAVGTGLVAREAVRLTGDAALVTGLDLSENMLAIARRRIGMPAVQGRAEALPVRAGSMDFLSMGYALRHVPDLAAAFAEFRRVLRPGGTVLLLEIGRPDSRRQEAIARIYLGRIVPALCRLFGPGREATRLMRYYWDTIETCVPPATILAALAGAGFARPAVETTLGIFRAYTATAPR
jgi:demethylmenaquinone methyltransferase / 2-methoxy-6-polyprenyl-1,4-benzoquinol methylase